MRTLGALAVLLAETLGVGPRLQAHRHEFSEELEQNVRNDKEIAMDIVTSLNAIGQI